MWMDVRVKKSLWLWRRHWKRLFSATALVLLIAAGLKFLSSGRDLCALTDELMFLEHEERPLSALSAHSHGPAPAKGMHYYDQTGISQEEYAALSGREKTPFAHPQCMDRWLRTEREREREPAKENKENKENPHSPTEREREIARYVQAKYRELGFDVIKPRSHTHTESSSPLLSHTPTVPILRADGTQTPPETIEINKKPAQKALVMQCDWEKLRSLSLSFSVDRVTETHGSISRFSVFSPHYLRFFSLILWQNRVYRLERETACVALFTVDARVGSFWDEISQRSSLVRRLVQHVNAFTRWETLSTNTCRSVVRGSGYQREMHTLRLAENERFFLHPADALLLSSEIAGRDPCAMSKSEAERAVNVSLLTLREDESLMRLTEREKEKVHETLRELSHRVHSKAENKGKDRESKPLSSLALSTRAVSLSERDSLSHWAQTFFDSDILFAGSSQILSFSAFMRPCSVLITLDWPDLVLIEEQTSYRETAEHQQRLGALDTAQVSDLARSADVLLQPLLLSLTSLLTDEAFLIRHPRCRALFSQLKENDTKDSIKLPQICLNAIVGLSLHKEYLRNALQSAIAARNKCMQSHPFYQH